MPCFNNFTAKSMNYSELGHSLEEFSSDIEFTLINRIKLKQDETQNQSCSSLTSIYMPKKLLNETVGEMKINKILVKLKLAASPFIKYRNRDATKRLLNVVETSYHDTYIQHSNHHDSTIYALLNVVDDEADLSDDVRISEFLFKQLHSSVYSKAHISTVNKEEILKIKKSVLLKASCIDVSFKITIKSLKQEFSNL
jgi:hypothetical protein